MFSKADKVSSSHISRSQQNSGTVFFRKAGEETLSVEQKSNPFFSPSIQPKLTVSSPDDPQEKEADAMADRVMRMAEPVATIPEQNEEEALHRKEIAEIQQSNDMPFLQRKCASCEHEEKLQRKEISNSEIEINNAYQGSQQINVQRSGDAEKSKPGINLRLDELPSFMQPSVIETEEKSFEVDEVEMPEADISKYKQIYSNHGALLKYEDTDVRDLYVTYYSIYRNMGVSRNSAANFAQTSSELAVHKYLNFDNPDMFDASNHDFGATVISADPRSLLKFVNRKIQSDHDGLYSENLMKDEMKTPAGVEKHINELDGKGNNLNSEANQFFSQRMGYDFSKVKIHTDSVAAKSADSINALAYTTGNNIVFSSGQYSPGTDSGKRLLAHELTHVVQQGAITSANIQKKEGGSSQKDKEDCKLSKIITTTSSYPPGVTGGIDSNNISIVVNWCKGDNKGDIKLGVDVPATAKRIGDKILNAAVNGTLSQLGDDLKTEELTPFIDILLNKGGLSLTAQGELKVGLNGVTGGKAGVIFSKGPIDIKGTFEKDEQGMQGGVDVIYTPGRSDKEPDCKTQKIPLKILCECKLPSMSVSLAPLRFSSTDNKEVFVYFPHWSYDIEEAKKDISVKALNDASIPLLEMLLGDEYKVMEITGYTSPEGSLEKINTKLSQDRADAVKAYIEGICNRKTSLLQIRPTCVKDAVKDIKPVGKNELYGSDEAGKELKGRKLAENTVKQFTENEQETGRRDETFMKSLEKLSPQEKADKIYPMLRRVKVSLQKESKIDKSTPITISGGTIFKDCPPEIAQAEKLKSMLSNL